MKRRTTKRRILLAIPVLALGAGAGGEGRGTGPGAFPGISVAAGDGPLRDLSDAELKQERIRQLQFLDPQTK